MKPFIIAGCISVMLMACNSGTDGTNIAAEASESSTQNEKTKAKTARIKIRNGIQLNAKGLAVSQAFLLYDDGKLVPETNTTTVGAPVNLRLIIDGGWQQKDGQVFIGAAERIETSEGHVLLDEKDLFSNVPSVRLEDAQYITLTANISQLNKLYDYFLVSFRVWDKKGKGEVTGSFKLHIQ